MRMGSLSYTPTANYNGSDSFTYRATDGVADSNVATVVITITPVADEGPLLGTASATANWRTSTARRASRDGSTSMARHRLRSLTRP